MATTSVLLQDPDFMEMYKQVLANSRWQNQLASGLGIANAGWKTALGLNIGTALGNWLGDKLWNWQQLKKLRMSSDPDPNNPTPQEKFPNVFGNVDLGWTPPPYQFLTAEEYIKDAPQVYNQNWRQNMINRALPVYWQPNLTSATTATTASPTPQTLAPTQTATPQSEINHAAGQAALRNTFNEANFGWKPNNQYTFSVPPVYTPSPYWKYPAPTQTFW